MPVAAMPRPESACDLRPASLPESAASTMTNERTAEGWTPVSVT